MTPPHERHPQNGNNGQAPRRQERGRRLARAQILPGEVQHWPGFGLRSGSPGVAAASTMREDTRAVVENTDYILFTELITHFIQNFFNQNFIYNLEGIELYSFCENN